MLMNSDIIARQTVIRLDKQVVVLWHPAAELKAQSQMMLSIEMQTVRRHHRGSKTP